MRAAQKLHARLNERAKQDCAQALHMTSVMLQRYAVTDFYHGQYLTINSSLSGVDHAS